MADVRKWLEESDRKIGSVVHTIENGQPLKATREADGTWTFEPEDWAHGKTKND